jgi:hypothetical protein
VTLSDLLVVHAVTTAVLLAVLWVVIAVQQIRTLVTRWTAAVTRSRGPRVERRRPLHPST